MSDSTQVIVDIEAEEHEAERLGQGLRAWLAGRGIIQPDQSACTPADDQGFAPGPRYAAVVAPGTSDAAFLRLATNGLRIRIGRRVFDGGGNGIELTCAACSATFAPGPGWSHSVGRWHEGDDDASYPCPSCLGGQVKSGQRRTGQNRPTARTQDQFASIPRSTRPATSDGCASSSVRI